MRLFVLCLTQIVLCTLGVLLVCGLAVEVCYRLCFTLMGKRAGRTFWFLTSFLGTPVHEGGHALMCLLFAHRIEKIRLVPTRAGSAMVEHSYNKRNPYATFGNLWIGLGPMFSGIAVILIVLYLVYPASMQAYQSAVGSLSEGSAPIEQIRTYMVQFLWGLVTEDTRAWWIRLLSMLILFSMALHIRLSVADVKGMLAGLPAYAVIAALVALVVAWIGQEAVDRLMTWLHRGAWLLVSLFSLILLFGLVQLTFVIIYRLLYVMVLVLKGKRARISRG